MFAWYRDAARCYVFLQDVTKSHFEADFPVSSWFTCGCTLQELLAPYTVIFYDWHWEELGTRRKLAGTISQITSIDMVLLRHSVEGKDDRNRFSSYAVPLESFSVAKRMLWASQRETTRLEDMAYCLLGLFGIHMPLLYGEGDQAFVRLQEEIMKKSHDDSILAWEFSTSLKLTEESGFSLSASSPTDILAKSPRNSRTIETSR
jgi:hypothetical protein